MRYHGGMNASAFSVEVPPAICLPEEWLTMSDWITRFTACCCLALLSLWPAHSSAADATAAPAKAVNYSEQIKPILAQRCYACHGPDAAQRKADLELHIRDKAIRE